MRNKYGIYHCGEPFELNSRIGQNCLRGNCSLQRASSICYTIRQSFPFECLKNE